ncbi:MAG: hypothetical protein ACXWL2_01415 [Candidatus Chromulinivorax sp.]
MKKQLYILVLLITVLSSKNFTHFNELIFFNENDESSKWSWLEKQFITEVENYKSKNWDKVASIIPATIIGTCLYQYCNITPIDDEFNKLKPSSVLPVVAVATSGLWALQSYKEHIKVKAAEHVLKKFFNNWEQNQFFIPKELQDGFDIIAEQIAVHGSNKVLINAPKIVETLQAIIMRHFEKRYEKILQINATNALNDTKIFTEIIRNSIQTSTFLNSSKK